MRKIGLLFALISLVVLTACSSKADPAQPKQNEHKKTLQQVIEKSYTADDVINKLRAAGLQIDKVDKLNESTDGNKLLGRPGQYTGKTDFAVKGLPDADGDPKSIDVDEGGSIESFSNVKDAKNRFDYIQAISKSGSMFAEYEYLNGKLILRLSKELLPSKAAEYEKAFQSLK